MPQLRWWRFALGFAVLYGLLIFPWPGLHHAVGSYVQAFGNRFFSRTGHHLVLFRARGTADKSWPRTTDTMILLINSDIPDKTAVLLDGLDTKQLFWLQFSFYLALVGATPMPWRRRAWAFFVGVLAAHVLLALSLTVYLADHASDISMLALSPLGKSVVAGFAKVLMVVSGPSTLLYFFIWPLACFRREDFIRLVPGWRGLIPKTAVAPALTRQQRRAQLRSAQKARQVPGAREFTTEKFRGKSLD